jgi:hypothetical protein
MRRRRHAYLATKTSNDGGYLLIVSGNNDSRRATLASFFINPLNHRLAADI